MLALVLALSLAACGKRVEDDVTAAGSPAPTEAPTEDPTGAPTEEPTEAPTEEPTEEPYYRDGLTFRNELEFPVEISANTYYHWYDRGSGIRTEAGESVDLDVDLSVEPNMFEEYVPWSLIGSDDDGNKYCLDMIELRPGSEIALFEREGEFFYRVERGDDSVEYPALKVVNSEPLPADERILGAVKQHFSGEEAAEQACRDGFDHADFSYQLIALDDASAAKYPKLRDALETERMAVYGRVIALYHSLVEEREHSGSSQRGDFRMEAFVRRADSLCLSVLYRFTLEYKGNTTVYWASSNLDSATGKTIGLADAVTDTAAFTEAVNAACGGEPLTADIWEDGSNLCMPAFTLDHDGVSVFFFESGESAFLPFSGYPSLFKSKYLPETEDFTVEFPLDVISSFETADGGVTELMASLNIDWEAETTYPSVISTDFTLYDGSSSGNVFRYFGMDSNIFTGPAASEYLFVCSGGRDFIIVRGCDFIEGALFIIGVGRGRLCALGTSGTNSSCLVVPGISPVGLSGEEEPLITDPNRFDNRYSVDGIGSAIGSCLTGLGGDGVPVRLDNVYYIVPSAYSGMEYTLLCDIEAERVNEAGESIGTIVLHEGDVVVYYRTDGRTWGDVKTANGRIARFYITRAEDWDWPPFRIGDVPVTDIFEGAGFIDW